MLGLVKNHPEFQFHWRTLLPSALFQQPLAALTPPPAPPGSIVASVHGAIAGAVAYAAQTTNVITAPTWNPHPITTLSNSPSPPAVGSNSVTEYAPSPSPSAGGIDTPKNSPSPSNVSIPTEHPQIIISASGCSSKIMYLKIVFLRN